MTDRDLSAATIPADIATTLLRGLTLCGDQITEQERERAWAWVEKHAEQYEEMGQW